MSLFHLAAPALLWLGALLVAWAALLFGGFALGRMNVDGTRRMPTWTRMASSLALALAAWSISVALRASGGAGDPSFVALLVALGMTLGLVGDLILAGILPLSRGRGDSTLGGIAAFGLGHVCYIAAFVTYGALRGLDAPLPRYGALAVWLLAGLAGWYVVVLRGGRPSVLRLAALPYALLLAGTAGVATGLAVQDPSLIPVALGGALFLASDLILAGELFNGLTFPLIGDVIWLTYGPAQALIVYGTAIALLATR
jgi:hypothetical protein